MVASPIAFWTLGKTGLTLERGMVPILATPIWYRAFAVVTAGVVEETLYRGYAQERFTALTGSVWSGGALAMIAFDLAHLPFWGPGIIVVLSFTGSAMTLFFIWREDLVATVVAHIVVDAMGLIVVPAMSHVT